MRTCEHCNTSKNKATKKMGSRWPSIWGQAADIPFLKSSVRRKTPLDARFGERSDRGGRAILRFWWPIRRRLKACWDGPPSAISPTSSRVRGYGCRKTRRAKKRLLRQAHALEQVDVARIRVKGFKKNICLNIFHAPRPLRVTFFQPLEGVVAVPHQRVVTRNLVGGDVLPLRFVFQDLNQRCARPLELRLPVSSRECLCPSRTPVLLHAHRLVCYERVLISQVPVHDGAVVVGRKFRIGGNKPVQLREGIVVPAQVNQDPRMIRVNLGRSRIERQRLLNLSQCLPESTQVL